jgi:purine-binding chemotaxis protein CheW
MTTLMEKPIAAPQTEPAPQASIERKEMTSDQQKKADSELLQLVRFVVGEEEFAVPILSVQEINRMMQITRVPQSPSFVEGVINLRGRIIPVADLRKRFGMEAKDRNSESRIIVVEVEERTLGFVVDRVQEVLRVNKSIVDSAPEMVTSIDSAYIEGIAKLDDRLLILLDLTRLFSQEQLRQIEQMKV